MKEATLRIAVTSVNVADCLGGVVGREFLAAVAPTSQVKELAKAAWWTASGLAFARWIELLDAPSIASEYISRFLDTILISAKSKGHSEIKNPEFPSRPSKRLTWTENPLSSLGCINSSSWNGQSSSFLSTLALFRLLSSKLATSVCRLQTLLAHPQEVLNGG